MITICWSVKGGSGTTVFAVASALVRAQRPAGALLVDLAGDGLAALGNEAFEGVEGVRSWLGADPTVGAHALVDLELPVGRSLSVLPAGVWRGGPCPKDRWELLGLTLRAESREVVVDLGSSPFLPSSGRAVLLAAADVSLLVIRPCYLALRLALQSPFRPTGVVLLRDEGRALKAADVEAALGVGVVAEIAVDPGVARAVDSGLLNTRLPRALERSARRAA